MRRRLSTLLAICIIALSRLAAAQQPGVAATIRGRVIDPQQNGVVAKVQAISGQTGLQRETDSDASGNFTLTNLAPGPVQLVVSAPGFAVRRMDLEVEVNGSIEMEIGLNLSNVEARVTVSGNAEKVDVLTSSVSSVVTAREIESLPLNGRNFLELAFLTPGNAPAPNFDPTKAQMVVVSSTGQLGRGGNITIDGMDNNDDVVGGPVMNISQDAVQEFQVATNRYSAELGRSASSTINVVSRSGSDAVHGSAAGYFRDQSWQALPATLDKSVVGEPPFSRQQASFTFGGPLVHQKLFGFGSLETRNQNGGIEIGTRGVETRSIAKSYASAPLDDLLGTARVDWHATQRHDVTIRYSGQHEQDTSSTARDRAIGSDAQRAESHNRTHAVLGAWNAVLSSAAVNAFSVSYSDFSNRIAPVAPGVQLTFPSLLDGASFRVPQATTQSRWQMSDALSLVRGAHQLKMGGQVQRVSGLFDLGVFRDGRIEFVEDFPDFDRNGDGVVNDADLLFAVTLRSGNPNQDLVIPDANNVHLAGFAQDDWRVHPQLTLNLGIRYEVDTDVNNQSRVDQLNPIVLPFVTGERHRDTNNWGPRLGFNWSTKDARTSVRGGYGIYYDRITLEIQSLERGLDGRALPIEVRAGNLFFMDRTTGQIPPFAPSLVNPFTGFILPGAGASGINIIDSNLQNPKVQQMSIGIERQIGSRQSVRVDVVHDSGTDFIIGVPKGTVYNPVVGGPDTVVNLESSAKTQYDGLLVSYDRRFTGRWGFRASYTLSSALNYSNDDQIPFSYPPLDPNNLARENGPTPNDQRHRVVLSGVVDLGYKFQLSGLWTMASGVPMDILMPDASTRVPTLQRNAGGRVFKTAGALNDYIRTLNASGGIGGVPLPFVSDTATFNDTFNSLDLRLSRAFQVGRFRIDGMAEFFNLFNVTNILGVSNRNYSGYTNVLVRDSNDPSNPGFLRSSAFGQPITTAGGVFGTGGPFALQLAARITF